MHEHKKSLRRSKKVTAEREEEKKSKEKLRFDGEVFRCEEEERDEGEKETEPP